MLPLVNVTSVSSALLCCLTSTGSASASHLLVNRLTTDTDDVDATTMNARQTLQSGDNYVSDFMSPGYFHDVYDEADVTTGNAAKNTSDDDIISSSVDLRREVVENFGSSIAAFVIPTASLTSLCVENGTNVVNGDGSSTSPCHLVSRIDDDNEYVTSLPVIVVVGSLVTLGIVAIVVGNAFVVASVFVYREMRTLTNWMIVSLASADLLVAVAVLPLSAYQEVVGGRWHLGTILCDFWVTSDVFCCTASILNIAAIALDRYWLITRNVAYTHSRRLPRRQACRLMAALAWIAAAVISAAPLLGWRTGDENDSEKGVCMISQDYAYTIFSTFGAFWMPLSVIVIVYGRIFWIAQRRLRRRMRQHLSTTAPAAASGAGATIVAGRPPSNGNVPATADPGDHELLPSTVDLGPSRRRSTFFPPSRSSPLFHLRRSSAPTNCRRGSRNTTPLPQDAANDAAAAVNLLPVQSKFLAPPSVSFNNDPGGGGATADRQRVGTTQSFTPSASNVGNGSAAATNPAGTSSITRNRRRQGSPGGGVAAANGIVSYRKCQYRRMRNSARMLGLIIGGFVLCWLPFFVQATAVPFCSLSTYGWCGFPSPVNSVVLWLGYSNSLLNPIIYAIWDRNFRRCFRRLASCDFAPGGGLAAAGLQGGGGANRRLVQGPPRRAAAATPVDCRTPRTPGTGLAAAAAGTCGSMKQGSVDGCDAR